MRNKGWLAKETLTHAAFGPRPATFLGGKEKNSTASRRHGAHPVGPQYAAEAVSRA